VLEAIDPAAAILEFAKLNYVNRARQNSMLRTLLGSVSAKVAAEANCTVTVVRTPRAANDAKESAKGNFGQRNSATDELISRN
jgi:eukaryotic-like serine/threonine-protein kinase